MVLRFICSYIMNNYPSDVMLKLNKRWCCSCFTNEKICGNLCMKLCAYVYACDCVCSSDLFPLVD